MTRMILEKARILCSQMQKSIGAEGTFKGKRNSQLASLKMRQLPSSQKANLLVRCQGTQNKNLTKVWGLLSILASHPATPGSILGVPNNFFLDVAEIN